MKKLTLVATAIMGLLSASAAMAQSTVTVYGVLDGGYNRVTGLKQGTVNQLASGIIEGSRFGLRGTEDIGGGYKAIFTLENRFELDTGSVTNRAPSGGQLPDRLAQANLLLPTVNGVPFALLPALTRGTLQTALNVAAYGNAAGTPSTAAGLGSSIGVNTAGNLFDRQAFAGLITPFGAFTLGRQYTPAYIIGASFDASQTESSLAAGQVASFPPAFDIRLSNTIQYGIKLEGLTAALMYGAGEVAGAGNSAGRFYGAMAMYKADGWGVGIGHNARNNELGQKSLTNNVIGASVDIGPGALYGQFATVKDENPTGLSGVSAALIAANAALAPVAPTIQAGLINGLKQDANLMHVGYRLNSGVHTVVVAYSRYDDKKAANNDTSSYGVRYSYALSKRTSLNAVLTRFSNKNQAQAAPGGNGFLGGVTSDAGVGSTNLALGIRHTF
ncbi:MULTISPECIES: porin [unclassified Polaromonas]|jgi:predicted porin|uniref:porin n=1 Tax=unclassified Polaromonas TaxID=2638319 RepID=UPI000F092E8E|nr:MULTISPECIES: porin [unclassified Polaromonas]AYQ28331.1 porin [Polaromonas sp. SP1]QGJ20550.1 porin [Polaromonas sp. Pch-P]